MTTGDIYETTFDEGGRLEPNANQYHGCGGRVTTDPAETVRDDCGLVVNGRSNDFGPERRGRDTDDRKRTEDRTRVQPSR